MWDQGYDLNFHAKYCEIRKTNLRTLVERVIEALGNVYILDEIQGEKATLNRHMRVGYGIKGWDTWAIW